MITLAQPGVMMAAYFEQNKIYFSGSKECFLQVEDMHPAHAANAAARYLREASHWAQEVGVYQQTAAWMIQRPLFLALVNRANEI